MNEATEGDDKGGDVVHGYHSPWRWNFALAFLPN
jgi:hypothetical protein